MSETVSIRTELYIDSIPIPDKILYIRSMKPVNPEGEWTPEAVRVLNERYLMKENGVVVETPDECMWRVAYHIATADAIWGASEGEIYNTACIFYDMMVTHQFLPNSPTIMNAGTYNGLQWSACFVKSPEDSIVDIFDTMKYSAIIAQSGGGIGHGLGNLRGKGSPVKKSQGEASGPVSFLKAFNAASGAMVQGGRRRGANMATLPITHPDIDEFITCKDFTPEGSRDITNFNISVLATNQFMDAVISDGLVDIVDPQTKDVIGQRNAKELFDKITQAAHRTGDPGLLFIDKANNSGSNPIPSIETLISTNPCGEIYIGDFDACNLGSINIGAFVQHTNEGYALDTEDLRKITIQAIHFLDNVVELNPFPLSQITEKVKSLRRLGLGVMGWADMLFMLQTSYDSSPAIHIAKEVMRLIQHTAIAASEELAEIRGPFPLFSNSIYAQNKPRRNSQVTAVAPTGTISIISGCSSGIEPVFALAFEHRVKLPDSTYRILPIVNQTFLKIAHTYNFYSEDLIDYIVRHGTIKDFNSTNPSVPIPSWVVSTFVTAMEIHYYWHIEMQSAFQYYVDNAVSKSINMINTATVEDIEDAYILAYNSSCKGITVFRDGCLSTGQVLNVGKKESEIPPTNNTEQPSYVSTKRDRPPVVFGYTRKIDAPEGTTNITINSDIDGPFEVFLNIGKAGSDVAALAEALGRMISLNLRAAGPVNPDERLVEIATQLEHIGGSRSIGFGTNRVVSLPDAIAKALNWHLANGLSHVSPVLYDQDTNVESKVEQVTTQSTTKNKKQQGSACPSCKNMTLVLEEGCKKCPVCGYSEC